MTTEFTKIINKEIPARIVYEDEKFISFLPLELNAIGHILLVPKKEIPYVFDLSDKEYIELMKLLKFLSEPLKKALNAKRIGIVIEGFGIEHVHIHMLPINGPYEIDYHIKYDLNNDELNKLAEKIKYHFDEFIESNINNDSKEKNK